MKQVPEGTKVSRKEQLNLLRSRLIGNQAFGSCRGKFGEQLGQLTADWIETSESPTSVLGKLDSFAGQARIMTNLLAQFRRDGMNVAYQELLKALNDSSYLLPGERLALEATRPITVLVLEPKKTFTFLRWLLECHWSLLRGYLAWKDKSSGAIQPDELTMKLYEQFPNLEELARVHASNTIDGMFEGKELSVAYSAIEDSFNPAALKKAMFKMGLTYGQWNNHIEEINGLSFIYVFDGQQSETLARFSRKDQKRIATWQINVPKDHTLSRIGFYPTTWSIRNNPRMWRCTSRGSSHGFKAICFGCDRTVRKWFATAHQGQAEARQYGMLFN